MANLVLATAYIEMIPSARGINGAVERQFAPAAGIAEKAGRDSGEAFSQQAEGRISQAAGRIGGALKAALAVGGAVVAAAGAVGLKTAGQLEQAEISFTTMLGSGEKAQAFLADLSTFAAKTPFDLPGLNKSAGSLISAGIEANKVIPIMTSLGNATSGMGTGAEGVQRATVAIQQMNAAGKIGAEDLNQLRDAGVPVFDLLTAATGKTTAEIADMAAKGKLGRQELDQLMTALETGKGLERFNGLMEQQSQSLVGLASTFKDTFEVGLAGAIEPLIPLVKDGLAGATLFLSDVALPKLTHGLGLAVAVATETYNILTKGDFTGQTAIFGIYEDSKLIDFLFDLREAGQGAREIFQRGEMTGQIFGLEADHGFIQFLFTLREHALGVRDAVSQLDFTSVRGFLDSVAGMGGTTAPILADIGNSLAALWPAMQEFSAQAPNLATGGLAILAGALGFLAEHVDTIIANMPLIVGGFIAWKLATLGIAAASAVAIPVQIALNVSRIAAAKAERGLAADLRHSIAALSGHTVSTGASATASTIAAGAATAQGAAVDRAGEMSKLAAAKQWLLNAALSANPIGIVLVAIGALVAGLIWFFTQTEIGQQIVQAAWAGIQHAVGAVADWFQTHVMPTVKGAIDVIAGAVTWLWDNIISPYFGFIGTVLNAFGMLVGKIVEIAVAVIKLGLGAAVTWLWGSVISPVFTWISDKIELAALGWQVVLGKAKQFIDTVLAPAFTWLWKNIVQPAMDGIGSAVQWVWDRTLGPVFGVIGDAIEKNLPKAFDLGVKAVETAWNKLQEIAKAPVKFVIEKVLNEGLIANVNKIADKVKVGRLPDVALPAGWRKGGYTGDGNPNEVAGPVHYRELVLPEHVTSKLSDAERHALVTGGLDAVHGLGAPMRGSEPHIWGGPQMAAKAAGVMKFHGLGTFPMGMLQRAVASWQGLSGLDVSAEAGVSGGFGRNSIGVRYGGMANPNWIGYYQGQEVSIKPGGPNPLATLVHEVGHAIGLNHNTGNTSVMHPMLAGGGGAIWPTGYDQRNLQSIYGMPGSGGRTAGDGIDGGTDGKGFLDTILEPFRNIATKLIDGIKDQFPGAGTFVDLAIGAGRAVLDNAVKFLTDSIGKLTDIASDIWEGAKNILGLGQMEAPLLYDNGGLLQPGISLVENRTRRPEPILTGAQWDDLTEGGGSAAPAVYVQNPFTGEWLLAQVEDIAVGATGDAIDTARTRSRRGGKYQGVGA